MSAGVQPDVDYTSHAAGAVWGQIDGFLTAGMPPTPSLSPVGFGTAAIRVQCRLTYPVFS